MHDADRIDEFCQRLNAVWKTMPHFRFGQVVCGASMLAHSDLLCMKDDEVIMRIEEMAENAQCLTSAME